MLLQKKNTIGNALLLVVFLGLSGCHPSERDTQAIEVAGAVMPVLPPGQSTGVVYLTLRNNTDNMVVLNHLVSDITDHIEVHRNFYENGMMKMREVHHLKLDPKSKLLFEPGGYHLMLFNIDTTPSVGDSFGLTLEFEGGRSVTAQVAVKDR